MDTEDCTGDPLAGTLVMECHQDGSFRFTTYFARASLQRQVQKVHTTLFPWLKSIGMSETAWLLIRKSLGGQTSMYKCIAGIWGMRMESRL